MENREVALILRETAQLLEIDGAIIGRYRSYEKVADLLFSLPERIEDIAKDVKKLRELPGIGENMAEHIREILETGDYKLRQKLLKKYPPTLLELLDLQSLGPEESRVPLVEFQMRHCRGLGKARSRRETARPSGLRRKKRAEHSESHGDSQALRPAAFISMLGIVEAERIVRIHKADRRFSRVGHGRQARCAAAAKPSAISICSSRCARGRTNRKISTRSPSTF